jgi:hypothetical protein
MDADKNRDLARVQVLWYVACADVAKEKTILGVDILKLRPSQDKLIQADEKVVRANETCDAARTRLMATLMNAGYSFGSEVSNKYSDLFTEMAGGTNKGDVDATEEVLEDMRNAIRDYVRTKDRKTLWSRRSDLEAKFVNREKEGEFHRYMRALLRAMMQETFEQKDGFDIGEKSRAS